MNYKNRNDGYLNFRSKEVKSRLYAAYSDELTKRRLF